ncbi:MAG: gluconate 2-dehydrogenase subunit 3 family protein [Bacteroidota bacterium]
MNRRSAVKQVLFVSAGAVLIPACFQDKASVTFSNFSLTGSQEKMLASLASAIIPTTSDFIGAADIKAHQFALMMIDECETPETQKKFAEGMADFEKLVDKQYNQNFNRLSKDQSKELLTKMEVKTGVPESVQMFYQAFKTYTIQAFTSSDKYMTNVRKYKMVPGSNFKGCVPVASKNS